MTTTIEEAKELSTYSLESLIGNLTSSEVQMKEKELEDAPKKKSIAFKASIESDDSDVEKDLALIIYKLKKFLKEGRFQKMWHRSLNKKDKREMKKNKALQATWDDSDSSTYEEISSDGEVAHMYFMAKSSEVSSLNNVDDFSMDELLEAFNDHYLKYNSLNVKCKSLNKSFVDAKV